MTTTSRSQARDSNSIRDRKSSRGPYSPQKKSLLNVLATVRRRNASLIVKNLAILTIQGFFLDHNGLMSFEIVDSIRVNSIHLVSRTAGR